MMGRIAECQAPERLTSPFRSIIVVLPINVTGRNSADVRTPLNRLDAPT